jgi:hypothetical protein
MKVAQDSQGAGIYIGGTELLALFLGALFASRGGKLSIVTPFVSGDIFTRRSIGGWASLPHDQFSLLLVSRGEETECTLNDALMKYPWRRLEIRRTSRLHGKMYLLREYSGAFVGMVGSHNLTNAGLRDNLELGVLFRGVRGSPLQVAFDRCEREVEKLYRMCTPRGRKIPPAAHGGIDQ